MSARDQPRQPGGQSIGGQFDKPRHGEPTIELGAAPDPDEGGSRSAGMIAVHAVTDIPHLDILAARMMVAESGAPRDEQIPSLAKQIGVSNHDADLLIQAVSGTLPLVDSDHTVSEEDARVLSSSGVIKASATAREGGGIDLSSPQGHSTVAVQVRGGGEGLYMFSPESGTWGPATPKEINQALDAQDDRTLITSRGHQGDFDATRGTLRVSYDNYHDDEGRTPYSGCTGEAHPGGHIDFTGNSLNMTIPDVDERADLRALHHELLYRDATRDGTRADHRPPGALHDGWVSAAAARTIRVDVNRAGLSLHRAGGPEGQSIIRTPAGDQVWVDKKGEMHSRGGEGDSSPEQRVRAEDLVRKYGEALRQLDELDRRSGRAGGSDFDAIARMEGRT